jgi:hypothetical protein
VSINIVVFEAGALPGFPASLGRPSVTVLASFGDPASEPTPGEAISDFCTPLSTQYTKFGLSQDNPATGDNEAGYEVRRNPHYGGTYTFRWYAESMRDADGDGYENPIDTCPFEVNADNSPKVDTGPDNDGIDSACEASMRTSDPNWPLTQACWPGAPGVFNDCDGDGFYNRGDNCPLVDNPTQADADTDDIGDACDNRGNGPNSPDGQPIVVTREVSVEITGPPVTVTPTATPTPTPSHFNPSFAASLSSNGTGDYADVSTEFAIPAPDYNFDAVVTFTPPEFTVATDADVPNGAIVGKLEALATLGLINQPCTSALPMTFDLMDATTDPSATVTFDDQFQDADGNTLPDGVDKYPDFLARIFPGLTPRARHYGQASVAGSPVSLNFVVFEPGVTLPGLGPVDPALGYPSVTILNNNGDPAAVPAPSAITDFCTPLSTAITTYGISDDNPATGTDEGGYSVRANPVAAGTYSFSAYARSLRDADSDGIENQLDTCPFDPNAGSPRIGGSGDQDNDGIDDVCDPTKTEANTDPDNDLYMNRGDNCPLVANGADQDNQADKDTDGIGDACDPSPLTPNGSAIERWLESSVYIAGEACAPVIPGTYNGTVTINGQPAPDGTLIQAFVQGLAWASDVTSGGHYVVDVPQTMPVSPPCFAGGWLSFQADGAWCEPSVQWSLGLHNLNLQCGELATKVRIGSGQTPPGGQVTLPLDALDVPPVGLGAFTVDIAYEAGVVTPTSYVGDPDSRFDTVLCNLNYGPDTVRCTGIRATSDAVGDLMLAEITFEVEPDAPMDYQSPLALTVATFADTQGYDIPHATEDGSIRVGLVGNVDCDQDVDAVDALFILQYVVGLRSVTNQCPLSAGTLYLPAADAQCDNDVDAVDALFVLQHVVGLRPELCSVGGPAVPTATPTSSP